LPVGIAPRYQLVADYLVDIILPRIYAIQCNSPDEYKDGAKLEVGVGFGSSISSEPFWHSSAQLVLRTINLY